MEITYISAIIKTRKCSVNELKRQVEEITNTMLSNSLHGLENDELIIRIQYNEMPVRVEYALTDKGKSLLPIFYELTTWWDNYKK